MYVSSRDLIVKQLYDVIGKCTLHTCMYPVETIVKQLCDVIATCKLHTCMYPVET